MKQKQSLKQSTTEWAMIEPKLIFQFYILQNKAILNC